MAWSGTGVLLGGQAPSLREEVVVLREQPEHPVEVPGEQVFATYLRHPGEVIDFLEAERRTEDGGVTMLVGLTVFLARFSSFSRPRQGRKSSTSQQLEHSGLDSPGGPTDHVIKPCQKPLTSDFLWVGTLSEWPR